MSIQISITHKKSTNRSTKATADSLAFFPNANTIFKNTELEDFCPRKLFEVVFANELTLKCYDLLEGIIKIHEELRAESNIVFISRRSVINFIKEVVEDSEDNSFEHPPSLKDHLHRICHDLDRNLRFGGDISRKHLALIMKHKLINEMYTQYAKDARLDHEICQKEELLRKLQRSDVQKQIRFSEMQAFTPETKRRAPKKTEHVTKLEMSDYTSYVLPDNLHGSEDLKDHIYFYVFVGFQDPCLLKLLMRYKVPVNCILQISRRKDADPCEYTYFWRKMREISRNGEKFKALEDAAQLKYINGSVIPDDKQNKRNFFKERHEELEELLMSILDLKRKHLFYIKHLYPSKFRDLDIKYGPFPTYEENLRDIPVEYVTIPFIVQSMLLEVEKNFVAKKQNANFCRDDPAKNVYLVHQGSTQPAHILYDLEDEKVTKSPCPFSINYFKPVKKKEKLSRQRVFRKFYEGDHLNMNLSADRRAKAVAISDMKILMNQRFFHCIKNLEKCKDVNFKLPHVHHQGTPSRARPALSLEQTDHFLNLFFLSSMAAAEDSSKNQENPAKSFICSPYDFYDNRNFLPRSISMLGEIPNLYRKFNSMLLRWREPLSISTLAQWLFEAQQEYAEINFRYCEATDSLVVHFHQDLEVTGTRTRIWKESLRTLTCFRDFCSHYYLEEADWFTKFKPIPYVDSKTYAKNEEKYVFERIIESNGLYKNYEKYLIPYYYCDNFDTERLSCTPNSDTFKKFTHIEPMIKPNFEEIIAEIKSHPSSKELTQFCSKSFPESSLTAYDDSPPRFGLTGTTNDFFSHDGVRVTVDTCRFHFENFKLSLSVKFDGHTLMGHYRNGHVDPHLLLQDGTVIKLILPSPKQIQESDSCTLSEDLDGVKSILGFNLARFKDDPDFSTDFDENVNRMPTWTPEVKRVIPVYSEDLESINIDLALVWNKIKQIRHEKNVNRDMKILNRMLREDFVHKYVDSPKLRFVKRKYKFLEIPLNFYIRRILKESMKKKCRPMNRRKKISIKNQDKLPPTYQKTIPHIKLSMPNGLILETLTLDAKEEIIVKQTHLHREKYKNISGEDYRLFLDHGTVLIRFCNGNMRILDSQATIVDLKQKQRDGHDLKKCFGSIDTCRKMIYKLSLTTNRVCHDIRDYSRTRRGHLSCSKTLQLSSFPTADIDSLNTLYSSVNIRTLDGFSLRIRDNTVEKKQFSKVLTEWHFQTGQSLVERTDGMRVWNRDNGDQAVIFPDGTKITKTVQVEETLEFFVKRDKQGWVIVNHNYLYEHPLYCPVKLDQRNLQTSIILKKNVELKMSKLNTLISVDGKSEILITTENLRFTKMCPKCKSKCTCDIAVNLKVGDAESSQLLICKDSYGKVFTSDFLGRCQINKNFIEGELNDQNCNHVLQNDYHKAFLINPDLTGYLLWNENMIVRELKKMEEHVPKSANKVIVEEFKDVRSQSVGVVFKKNHYEHISERFIWPKYLQPILFANLEPSLDDAVTHQVCRRIFSVLGEKDTNILYRVVRNVLHDNKDQNGRHNIRNSE
ncbi:uncharacterized protein LOC123314137 [Coccinella septempunctata]|uniref:uncharacterized protein LOC123314137 n=1 Tax=Coccinella septempunctata TaxID=41139 RepID=UPI001D082382|nr:uncharacterized protein LOC123314137 [Coccinella septempunctata]